MKSAPNSRTNLDKAILRFAGEVRRANELRTLMANAIVAQMIGDGVVKGGSGIRFRFGDVKTRASIDLDTAWRTDLNTFLGILRTRLSEGWNGFSGEVRILRQASPKGIPFEYVMQPCEVKLSYRSRPWFTVQLEIGHNEIGDADEYEEFLPEELASAFEEMQFPRPRPLRVMKLSYQIAQKLHALSEEGSDRAHDLIDLMLIGRQSQLDFADIKSKCVRLFDYRRKQAWPPAIRKGDEWNAKYEAALGTVRDHSGICPTADEAVVWVNEFVAKIVQA